MSSSNDQVLVLNKLNMNIRDGRVHLQAVLDLNGVEVLERKLASLKALLTDDASAEPAPPPTTAPTGRDEG